jgi:hypothetical protein
VGGIMRKSFYFLICIWVIFAFYNLASATTLPDTGQTQSYTGTFGEDSDYLVYPLSYTKLDSSGNPLPNSAISWAMVKDNNTGLIWEAKTTDGSMHDWSNIYNWLEALAFLSQLNNQNFGGYNDWRIPTIFELATLVHYDAYLPAIDTDFFPNGGGSYISTTGYAYNDKYNWQIDFNHGAIDPGWDKNNQPRMLRVVRGQQFGSNHSYIDNGDGTVTDTMTGLMWFKNESGPFVWENALIYCEGLTFAGYDDWRMPNIKELLSIVDFNRYGPAWDINYFPDIPPAWEKWQDHLTLSSTTKFNPTPEIYAWALHFYHGQQPTAYKNSSYWIRPVRNSWPDNDKDSVPNLIDNCLDDYNPNQSNLDGDGLGDVCDLCPTDPNKTNPGTCGCGIADTDSDGDSIPDCIDDCDNSIDSDGDGTYNCDELCDNDPNKTDPGTCGCGVAETDTDNDGTKDCVETDDDNDGLPDGEEQGPNGNDPNYDGNDDGTADSLQDNVASFHTYDDQNYVTLESPAGTSISNCKAVGNPSSANAPSGMKFSYGFFEFTITGMGNGGATTVTLHFPVGTTFDTYYKFGSTSNNAINHWYEFLYDNQTGAEINGNVITLHFVDDERGDDDLLANGIVVDVGAPAAAVTSSDGGGTVAPDSGGGGGCFIATAAFGSMMAPHVKILRDFRDRFLLHNSMGKGFVGLYYTYSPPIADFIAKHDNLRAMVRISLLPVVGVSWVAIKLGMFPTVMLMLLFSIGMVGLLRFRMDKK